MKKRRQEGGKSLKPQPLLPEPGEASPLPPGPREVKGKEESWGAGGDGLGGGGRGEPNPATGQMPPNPELKPE